MLSAALLCLVVAITDGDTIKARCGEFGTYEQITIRIAAIDAPERRQPFGDVSRQHLAGLCFKTWARVQPRSHDRYGRVVSDVECRGQDVAAEQVKAGMAWYYVNYGKGYEHLLGLEASARIKRKGLWSTTAVPPWEWRRDRRPISP